MINSQSYIHMQYDQLLPNNEIKTMEINVMANVWSFPNTLHFQLDPRSDPRSDPGSSLQLNFQSPDYKLKDIKNVIIFYQEQLYDILSIYNLNTYLVLIHRR